MKCLMEYKIISGRTVEIRRCWLSKDRNLRRPRGTRRAGASSEKKIKANERSSMLKLGRTINCNFEAGDWFLTFKYDDPHYPAGSSDDPDAVREETYQACRRIFTRKFLPKLREQYEKQTGKKLGTVYVTANWSTRNKRPCRIHHHAVMPQDALSLAEKLWKKYGGSGGTLQAETLSNEGDYTRLASYMMDNVHDRPAGENRWNGSRGLKQPEYTEPVEVKDLEGIQPEYQSTIKEHISLQDEDGRTVSSYLRCVLKQPPKIRGGQIILPRQGRRRADE